MSNAMVPSNGRAVQAAAPATDPDRARVDLLKRNYAKDADDQEFELFAEVCRSLGLSPQAKQIYAVSRWNKEQRRKTMTIQIGIDGLRLIAQRSEKYGGTEQPQWCGPDGRWTDVWLSDEKPAAAKVAVWRAGARVATVGIALYKEFCQDTAFWRDMPANQLAIAAERQALRKAFQHEIAAVERTLEECEVTIEDSAVEPPPALSAPHYPALAAPEPDPPASPPVSPSANGRGAAPAAPASLAQSAESPTSSQPTASTGPAAGAQRRGGQPPEDTLTCETCGAELAEVAFRDGTRWLPRQLANLGRQKHARVLCMDHYRQANMALHASEAAAEQQDTPPTEPSTAQRGAEGQGEASEPTAGPNVTNLSDWERQSPLHPAHQPADSTAWEHPSDDEMTLFWDNVTDPQGQIGYTRATVLELLGRPVLEYMRLFGRTRRQLYRDLLAHKREGRPIPHAVVDVAPVAAEPVSDAVRHLRADLGPEAAG